MQLRCALTGVAAITLAAPLQAQAEAPSPTPATAPSYDDIQLFYLAHPGLSVWLANDDGRAAAAKIVALLKESRIDGFEQGPQLAASAALARARDRAALARALLERARPRLAARVDRRGHPALRALSVC